MKNLMATIDEFIVGSQLNSYTAFFEQDDATGYFYLADASGVLYALHIYNCKPSIGIREEDVRVIWTEHGERCGVVIHEKLCGSSASMAINADRHMCSTHRESLIQKDNRVQIYLELLIEQCRCYRAPSLRSGFQEKDDH